MFRPIIGHLQVSELIPNMDPYCRVVLCLDLELVTGSSKLKLKLIKAIIINYEVTYKPNYSSCILVLPGEYGSLREVVTLWLLCRYDIVAALFS
jgi:hypothetical protein